MAVLDYGSRMHILDWVENIDFVRSINNMLKPTGVIVPDHAFWMPINRTQPAEAKPFLITHDPQPI
jgi:hypothetical protein